MRNTKTWFSLFLILIKNYLKVKWRSSIFQTVNDVIIFEQFQPIYSFLMVIDLLKKWIVANLIAESKRTTMRWEPHMYFMPLLTLLCYLLPCLEKGMYFTLTSLVIQYIRVECEGFSIQSCTLLFFKVHIRGELKYVSYTGMCRPNGSFFHKKSLDMGPRFRGNP